MKRIIISGDRLPKPKVNSVERLLVHWLNVIGRVSNLTLEMIWMKKCLSNSGFAIL